MYQRRTCGRGNCLFSPDDWLWVETSRRKSANHRAEAGSVTMSMSPSVAYVFLVADLVPLSIVRNGIERQKHEEMKHREWQTTQMQQKVTKPMSKIQYEFPRVLLRCPRTYLPHHNVPVHVLVQPVVHHTVPRAIKACVWRRIPPVLEGGKHFIVK